jgi:tetratricopeptide (TPR) repeat protein
MLALVNAKEKIILDLMHIVQECVGKKQMKKLILIILVIFFAICSKSWADSRHDGDLRTYEKQCIEKGFVKGSKAIDQCIIAIVNSKLSYPLDVNSPDYNIKVTSIRAFNTCKSNYRKGVTTEPGTHLWGGINHNVTFEGCLEIYIKHFQNIHKGDESNKFVSLEGNEVFKFAKEEEKLGNYNEAIKLYQQCYPSNVKCREQLSLLRKQLKNIDKKDEKNKTTANNITQKNLNKKTIFSIQKILIALGYKLGNPDGVIGTQTLKAIKEYQKFKDINQTGIIDNNLIMALNSDLRNKDIKQEKDIATSILLEAPEEKDIVKLNDLVLCQHHYVRPSPPIVEEVKKRYLKCDRLLEIANSLNKKSQSISSEITEIDLIDEEKIVDTEKLEREKRREAKLKEIRELQRLSDEATERKHLQKLKEQELIMQQQALERAKLEALEDERQRLRRERRREQQQADAIDQQNRLMFLQMIPGFVDMMNPAPTQPPAPTNRTMNCESVTTNLPNSPAQIICR